MNTNLDFIARQAYYLDHLIPVWKALPEPLRGDFFVVPELSDLVQRKFPGMQFRAYLDGGECGEGPILAASYGDACKALEWKSSRPVILMEHGAGLTFGKAAYADGLGQRINMALIPVQSKYVLNRVHPDLRHIPHPVVGVPKLDRWAGEFNNRKQVPSDPVIAISFHHGSRLSRPAEVGSAWEHYIQYLPQLAKGRKLIAHCHPLMQGAMSKIFRECGITFVEDFEEVMDLADIYINDCSSTMYEFLVTGKPVIVMNAPWFDKKSKWGLRFWEFSEVGPNVDYPEQLPDAIDDVIRNQDKYRPERSLAVSTLFPYLGSSSARMVSEICTAMKFRPPSPVSVYPPMTNIKRNKFLSIRKSKDKGVIYMCFGSEAKKEMDKSIDSLREMGSTLPVAVVGDKNGEPKPGDNYEYIKWEGHSPFDSEKAEFFQFRAGRVKPYLYQLSPFKKTLYVDSDTRFLIDPEIGFGFLNNWDFVIAQERLAVSQLYNRPRAGWVHNIEERDATISEFGGDGHFPFWNSGVFFFKKNKHVEALFAGWFEEWSKWQQWDEQLSLMRSANKGTVRVFVLSEVWNFPHKEGSEIILHEYGRGAARTPKETK